MAQDKKKALPGQDPVLAGTPHMGELYGAPDKPSDQFIEEMKAAEAEKAMKAAGVEQDPVLEGTGQPGALYGAPEKPSVDPLTEAKREASKAISKEFNGVFWLRSLSPEIDFPNLNKHAKEENK